MFKSQNRHFKKIYIDETLNKRKYLGYRLDIVLIKFIIITFIALVVYVNTGDFLFTSIIIIQVFCIITLINKIIIDKKASRGKVKFLKRIKKDKFKKKIFSSKYSEIESFIFLYLNQNRYYHLKKTKNYCYKALKNDETILINVVKFYQDALIEKIDLRNYITNALNVNIDKLILITINDFSEEASKMLEKSEEVIKLEIINFEDLYEFADTNLLLSSSYEIISNEDICTNTKVKTSEIFNNIFNSEKIKIYLIASVTFYIIHKILLINKIGVYISYYFLFLTFINIVYNVYNTFIKKKVTSK
ncbi:hypothetical protein JYG23_01510 [Sedimentibacter sp. zth1]|uniref:hypothetical protein n=1 Tax=Sedimentibacter sp. zth1 TaxID=2816908 RepID=UPI001A91166B|nr:hypothetical protein [Sedimentibacter sp. zth1]QSX06170.1 hypothetical protein JYG23_01510 [Sedimentibacter sp. zth1]